MTILWWQWLVLGLVLLVAEMAAAGGFYFIFFGVAAVIVGLLASVEGAGPMWMQLFLFSLVSVGLLLGFRKRLLRRLEQNPQPPVDSLVGEAGTATEDIAPGEIGRVEVRGASWSARNRGHVLIPRDARTRVVGVDGLMLFVEIEGGPQ